jgi:hypothetical protein
MQITAEPNPTGADSRAQGAVCPICERPTGAEAGVRHVCEHCGADFRLPVPAGLVLTAEPVAEQSSRRLPPGTVALGVFAALGLLLSTLLVLGMILFSLLPSGKC